MRVFPLLLACLLIASAVAVGQPAPASMEAEIARIDRLATDPEAKLLVLQSMALDLGTHRNHLILLKKQGSDSFGQIYLKELRIPAKPITDSNLMAIRIPMHADHYRSEATRACFMMRK